MIREWRIKRINKKLDKLDKEYDYLTDDYIYSDRDWYLVKLYNIREKISYLSYKRNTLIKEK
jgi:hypothetical protein